MKIALYIEDGLEQIVLTPITPAERSILQRLHEGKRQLTISRGSFYHCQAGWMRQGGDEASTMLVLQPAPEGSGP